MLLLVLLLLMPLLLLPDSERAQEQLFGVRLCLKYQSSGKHNDVSQPVHAQLFSNLVLCTKGKRIDKEIEVVNKGGDNIQRRIYEYTYNSRN